MAGITGIRGMGGACGGFLLIDVHARARVTPIWDNLPHLPPGLFRHILRLHQTQDALGIQCIER